MFWTEKLANYFARKLVAHGSPHSFGVLSHGIELFLLYLANGLLLIGVSYLLGFFYETLWLMIVYMIYRNFTGGVHFKSPRICFYLGNSIFLGLALLIKLIPVLQPAVLYITIVVVFTLCYAINEKYAPARHTYVEYPEHMKTRNRKIIKILLIFGCFVSFFLVYLNYQKVATTYLVAVLLQSIALHPRSFQVIESFENIFKKEGRFS